MFLRGNPFFSNSDSDWTSWTSSSITFCLIIVMFHRAWHTKEFNTGLQRPGGLRSNSTKINVQLSNLPCYT